MRPLSTLTRLSVFAAIPLLAGYAFAADTATGVLGGTANVLNTVNQGLGAYGNSATQMQMLVNQLGTLNGLQGQGAAQMNQLNQIRMQLAMAVTEAQMCIQSAKKDTSKYLKATIAGPSLETVTPDCGNYGTVIDSIKKNADEVAQANTQVGCLKSLQNKINDLAESAKTPFNQLTQAANKVWQTRDKIIKIHKGIADQIERDVNGKGGFRQRMADLQKSSLSLNGAINKLAANVQKMKDRRGTVANAWYGAIMHGMQSCFESKGGQRCFDGSALSPAQCVQKYIDTTTKDDPVSRAQAGKNSQIFNSMNALTGGQLSDIHQPIQADADPETVIKIADNRFAEMLAVITGGINQTNFVGAKVNNAALSAYVRERYNYCYNSAKNSFRSNMGSTGANQYKNMRTQIDQDEAGAATEMKSLIQDTKNVMTDFRTAFTKTYNRDLSQFTANCTASENPYESLDCLRKVQGMLNSGINGHPETVKLGDGSMLTIDAGTMAIQIPNLQLDQSGNPSTSQAMTTCAGFQECITFMDNAKESHKKAELSQTEAQDKFVDQHNSDIQNVMGGIGQSFQAMSTMITQAVGVINGDLKNAGLTATLETKQAKGEELEKDETTKLYKMPKSMKAAFAGLGNYAEIGNLDSLSRSLDQRKSLLMKKMTEAAKKKGECQVKKSDYEAAASAIGRCDSERVCNSAGISKMLRPLEKLFLKSSAKGESEHGRDRDEISQDYERCMSRARKATAEPLEKDTIDHDQIMEVNGDERAELRKEAREQKKAQRLADEKEREDSKNDCTERAAGELQTMANSSRDPYRKVNAEVVGKLRSIGSSCPDDKDDAEKACNEAVNLLKGYNPTDANAETDLSSKSDSSSKPENPYRGASGAQ